jgi:multidrug efflux pump subunit AcrB
MEWRGEQFGTVDSQASLVPGIIPSFTIMVFIVVALFNAYRPPIVIFLVVPLAGIGITAGLLATRQPFSFMALLGAMSLVGMMIKNSIVLLDEIGNNRVAGKLPYDAVISAGLSRVRPVLLGPSPPCLVSPHWFRTFSGWPCL